MQYSVPQFIDIEDKIVGPLTAKQTVYLLIGGGFLMLIFSIFEIAFFAIIFIIVAPITLAFAFWRPKGTTIARWISNIINFYTSPHLYIWRRDPETIMFKATQRKKAASKQEEKSVSKNRIRELAWVLDTSTSIELPYEVKTRPEEKLIK